VSCPLAGDSEPRSHHGTERPGISAHDLRKSYPGGRGAPRIRAPDGLSVEVEAGTIFGLRSV
jgi:hypothetical protein